MQRASKVEALLEFCHSNITIVLMQQRRLLRFSPQILVHASSHSLENLIFLSYYLKSFFLGGGVNYSYKTFRMNKVLRLISHKKKEIVCNIILESRQGIMNVKVAWDKFKNSKMVKVFCLLYTFIHNQYRQVAHTTLIKYIVWNKHRNVLICYRMNRCLNWKWSHAMSVTLFS